jgi:GT2 family glycosyltransferase
MQFTILIVSKNRKEELARTLNILSALIDPSQVEVLVFLDGCADTSLDLQSEFNWVRWFDSPTSLGASVARHQIYPLANAEILIGLDDDAHPLQFDFLLKIKSLFEKYPNVAILAFEEIKGVYTSDVEAIQYAEIQEMEYITSEFIGCGFAIRKSVYDLTNGFPVWIDIYGEESCLSIEVLSKGYDILYTNKVKVNHRVDKQQRVLNKRNYFRFERQLKNSTYYFLVYYPKPLLNILKLYWHNFKTYALKDTIYFVLFFKVLFMIIITIPNILKYRKPVEVSVIKKIRTLTNLKF